MSDLCLGLMSGTSMDGIDAALVELGNGLEVLATRFEPYDPDTLAELSAVVAQPDAVGVDRLGRLDHRLGRRFAAAATALLRDAGVAAGRVAAIGSHGQTVRHSPGGELPFTLQLGDASIIAAQTGITTVADFRRADMALGGEGAPLAPAFHAAAFADPAEDRVVVNLGGIANVTLLPAAGLCSGFDTGPGNVLMNGWIRRHRDEPYDAGGAWAAAGAVDDALLAALLADDYFARPPPKSTGRELFNEQWLDRHLAAADRTPKAGDVQATLCELTARTVAAAVLAHGRPARCLVCGGGAHNRHLLARLAAALDAGTVVETTAAHGVGPDWVEAAAFAWLAARRLRGKAGNLPAVTGAAAPAVLGAVHLPPPA